MSYQLSHPIAFHEGVQARERNQDITTNGYADDSDSHKAWNEGWSLRDFYNEDSVEPKHWQDTYAKGSQ